MKSKPPIYQTQSSSIELTADQSEKFENSVRFRSFSEAEDLINKGYLFQKDQYKRTQLMNSLIDGFDDEVLFILKHPSHHNINEQCSDGFNALFYAIDSCPKMVKHLITAGADIHHELPSGLNPIAFALLAGGRATSTLQFLLESGSIPVTELPLGLSLSNFLSKDISDLYYSCLEKHKLNSSLPKAQSLEKKVKHL